jgi:CubicO group peptidase (beta-lactamase class C family)
MLLGKVCSGVSLLALALTQAGGADNLSALEKRLRSGEIPNVHGVLVSHKGKTVAEWYFEGRDERRGTPLGVVKFGPETIHDIRSVTKSIVSIVFGIAQASGAIGSLDTAALDYFPEYEDLWTPERRRITLRHLLSMTSGLHWDETTHPYTDPRNSETAMDRARDRLRFVLEQKVDAPPGEKFRYSGGDVALIAAIIARATKKPLDEFTRSALFAPLGVTKVEWLEDGSGVPIAASGLRMLPRDMAKIGLLMMNNGRHDGRQIVPEAWIKASVAPHALVEADQRCGFHYGYFWWLAPACDKSKEPGVFIAIGNGGQRILVVPDRALVVVVTAGLYNDTRQQKVRDVTDAIVGAVK